MDIACITSTFAAALALCASAAQAAALTVQVAGSSGAPLADAVALLEPMGTRAPVKPMPDVDIAQAKRQFAPRVTLITVGTKVNFPNFDTVRHHVYSFSPIKTFELKLYAGVPGSPVTFDKPGVAVLGCNIHDRMAAWVVVADTPWNGRSSADGTIRIEGVPAGSYQLRVWHAGLPAGMDPVATPLVVGAADAAQRVQLAVADL
jgi:plastocyanin